MNTELETQIREYAEFFDSTLERVEVESVVRAKFVPPRSPRRSGLLVTAAAAAFVLLIIGGGAWLIGSEPTTSPAGTVAPTPTPATPGASVAPGPVVPASPPVTDVPATAPPPTAPNTLIDPPEGRLRSIVAGGPGFVAVGETEDTPAVWTSPDGTKWTGAPVGTSVGGMFDVAIGGPGFVAVGASEGMPAVWTSSDGLAWTQKFIGEAPGYMYSVSFGEIGIATGYLECGPQCQEVPAGWVSEDGLAWDGVDYSDAVRFRQEADGAAAVVADLESGSMVLTVDGEWMSESAVDPARAVGGAPVEVVVPLEDGRYVAVGRTCDYSIAAWLSDDGVTWSWITLQPPDDGWVSGTHEVIVWGATVGKGQLVMVGAHSGPLAFVWAMPLEDLKASTSQEPEESCP